MVYIYILYDNTAGPKRSSLDNHWRMIWEQDVAVIIMLTHLREEGRVFLAIFIILLFYIMFPLWYCGNACATCFKTNSLEIKLVLIFELIILQIKLYVICPSPMLQTYYTMLLLTFMIFIFLTKLDNHIICTTLCCVLV